MSQKTAWFACGVRLFRLLSVKVSCVCLWFCSSTIVTVCLGLVFCEVFISFADFDKGGGFVVGVLDRKGVW